MSRYFDVTSEASSFGSSEDDSSDDDDARIRIPKTKIKTGYAYYMHSLEINTYARQQPQHTRKRNNVTPKRKKLMKKVQDVYSKCLATKAPVREFQTKKEIDIDTVVTGYEDFYTKITKSPSKSDNQLHDNKEDRTKINEHEHNIDFKKSISKFDHTDESKSLSVTEYETQKAEAENLRTDQQILITVQETPCYYPVLWLENQEQKSEVDNKNNTINISVTEHNEPVVNIPNINIEITKPNKPIPRQNNFLSNNEETYELEKFKKNAMIIFNHEHFLAGRRRLGTALDVAALQSTFEQFRFDVTTHNDLRKDALFEELDKFSKMNFNAFGCICVAILTHGQDHGYLRAYDTRYSERDVIASFDALLNPTLVAKPIIILIQACRGSTAAVSVSSPPTAANNAQNIELDADETGHKSRPTESDMIIFHSSFFGRASVRVVEEGTWFIQTICEQMKLHASTEHVETLFRRVRSIVALEKEYKGVKQMPSVTTTLLKKLYLKGITKEDRTDHNPGHETNVSLKNQVAIYKDEEKRFFMLNLANYFQRFVIAFLLTLIVFHQNFFISSYILNFFMITFELIRYFLYRAYVALEYEKMKYFIICLMIINTLKWFNLVSDSYLFVLYLYGGWNFVGGTFVAFVAVTLYVIYLDEVLLQWL